MEKVEVVSFWASMGPNMHRVNALLEEGWKVKSVKTTSAASNVNIYDRIFTTMIFVLEKKNV